MNIKTNLIILLCKIAAAVKLKKDEERRKLNKARALNTANAMVEALRNPANHNKTR